MRLLPLITISAVVFGGCSAGAGMQATPPAPISQTAGSNDSTGYAPSPSQTTARDTAADDDTQPPVSQSQDEKPIPTGAGGRFLLD